MESGKDEFGRLFQGFGDVEGKHVQEFIHKSEIPAGYEAIEILKTPPARPASAQDMIASHSNLSVVTSPTSVTPSHPLSALSAASAQTTRRISGITSLLARITHTHNY
jgi:hypothetical protein